MLKIEFLSCIIIITELTTPLSNADQGETFLYNVMRTEYIVDIK